jgi:putative transposase
MGANLWCMPVGGSVPAALTGFIKPTAGALGLRPAYRQLNEARIKTTTPDPALRLLFVAIALILRNAWAWVHYQLLAIPCRGGRKLNLGLLPFKTLLLWLAYLAIQTFGIVDSVAMAQAP